MSQLVDNAKLRRLSYQDFRPPDTAACEIKRKTDLRNGGLL
jgi:hypothetical protein